MEMTCLLLYIFEHFIINFRQTDRQVVGGGSRCCECGRSPFCVQKDRKLYYYTVVSKNVTYTKTRYLFGLSSFFFSAKAKISEFLVWEFFGSKSVRHNKLCLISSPKTVLPGQGLEPGLPA